MKLHALAIILAAAPSLAQVPAPRGEALHRALEGVWCNSSDGGRTCWALDEFDGAGLFRACGRTEDDHRPFHGSGRVRVTGQRMCYTVTAASDNFWLSPGQAYCTEIVAINDQTHRYRDIDTGKEYTLYRLTSALQRCPG